MEELKELLEQCSDFVGMTRFELGEDFDDDNLEQKINEFLKTLE